jgi:hypothetical protein
MRPVKTRAVNLHFVLFPGVVLHELAHWAAAATLGVRVRRVKLWGSREAHVEHDETTPWRMIPITVAPFVVGSAAAFASLFVSVTGLRFVVRPESDQLAMIGLFFWLGLSFAYHAFPSRQDAQNSLNALFRFYRRKLFFRDGIVSGAAWWLSVPLVFVPLALALFVIRLFSQVEWLGSAWFFTLLVAALFAAGLLWF